MNSLVEIVHEVLLLIVHVPLLLYLLELLVVVLDLLLESLDLVRVLLNDLLAEVRPFGELLLYFLVISEILGQILNNACH